MNCAVHTDVPATGYCRNCGKALCPECTRQVRGALYCEQCLAGLLADPPVAEPAKPHISPALAATLGFIPGLGAVYNGQYLKALIHVLIFGGLIALLSSDIPSSYDAFFGIVLGCFYFYMPIEAYRTANARRLGEPEPANLMEGQGRKPIGAFVLIGIGVLLLLGNFGLLQREWFEKTWPVALILIGGWLVWDRMKKVS
ncbi:MAG: B-box zinc finger protein [Candidatus Acidiferrales bacterium]